MEELLYADEESLENCKDLELIVHTLRPGLMQTKENSHQNDSSQVKESENLKGLDVNDKDIETNVIDQERCKFKMNTFNTFVEDKNADFSSIPKKWEEEPSVYETHNSQTNYAKCWDGKKEIDKSKCCNIVQDDCLVSTTKCAFSEHKKDGNVDEVGEEDGFRNILLNVILQASNFILDIDMDYFSTQNPFKLLYTEVSVKFYNYVISGFTCICCRSKGVVNI